MLPYYLIDAKIPIPQAYEYVGMHWAQTLVSVGAIASLITWYFLFIFFTVLLILCFFSREFA
jgi:hypothetical protein